VSSNLKKRLGLIRSVKEGISGQPGWAPRRRLGQKVSASWLLVSLGIYTRGLGRGIPVIPDMSYGFFLVEAAWGRRSCLGYEAAGSDG
jgi:hypothetical protein